jgi:hypothetical protein
MDVSLEGLIGAAEVGTASRVDAFGNLASIEEPMSCPALSMRSDMFVQRRAEAGKHGYPSVTVAGTGGLSLVDM